MLHSATIKKAEKIGVVLTETTDEKDNVKVVAHWPQHNIYAYAYGLNASKLIFDQIDALKKIKAIHSDWRVVNHPDPEFEHFILVFNEDRSLVFDRAGATPTDTLTMLTEWMDGDNPREWMVTAVPEDGGEAYKAGFTAADNPYRNSDDDEEADPDELDEETQARLVAAGEWDEAFDAAADAAEAGNEGSEDETSGSVVKSVYRQRYAELGHPNHCGDWLAELLNNLIIIGGKTDTGMFERICLSNGVDLSKYKHEGNGWQGRLRMTGRNLLARRVYQEEVFIIPDFAHPEKTEQHIVPPAEWMNAQKFQKKAKPPQAVPAADATDATMPMGENGNRLVD